MINYPIFLQILTGCNSLEKPLAEVLFCLHVKNGQATTQRLINLIGKIKTDNYIKSYIEKSFIETILINPDSQQKQYVINRKNSEAIAYFDSIEKEIDAFFAATK